MLIGSSGRGASLQKGYRRPTAGYLRAIYLVDARVETVLEKVHVDTTILGTIDGLQATVM